MPKNITVDCTDKVKKEGFFDVQNVPPLTPFRAVKSVNLPAAGVVNPMVELLITTLLIVPPLMFVLAVLKVITFGFINHCNHA
jgi:hypothetical protein